MKWIYTIGFILSGLLIFIYFYTSHTIEAEHRYTVEDRVLNDLAISGFTSEERRKEFYFYALTFSRPVDTMNTYIFPYIASTHKPPMRYSVSIPD